MKSISPWRSWIASAASVALAVALLAPAAQAEQKQLKVYVSTGFDGNTWMNASTNSSAGDREDQGLQGARHTGDPIRPR